MQPPLQLNNSFGEPLSYKQEPSEEFSYTGFVPIELPYYVDSSDALDYSSTTQRPKPRRNPKKRKNRRKNKRRTTTTTTSSPYYYDYDNEIDQESPKQGYDYYDNPGSFISLIIYFFDLK